MSAFRRQYALAKEADEQRNALFAEMLTRIDDLEKTMDRNAFVLVLIDGDCMNFHNEFISQGMAGGDEAAKLLRRSVFEYLRHDETFKHDYKILVKVYANFRGLSKTYANNGIIPNTTAFYDFVCGFNKAHPFCDIVDAGNHKEAADTKLKEVLNLYVYNVHCKQIIFGASADNGYANFLSSLSVEMENPSRIRLLKEPPFSREFRLILDKFEWTEFEDVFRSELIVNGNVQQSPWRRSQIAGPTNQDFAPRTTTADAWPAVETRNNEASAMIVATKEGRILSPEDSDSRLNTSEARPGGVRIDSDAWTRQDQARPATATYIEHSKPTTKSHANLDEGVVIAALMRATNERLEESPKALDFGIVKSKAEHALGVTPEFWGKNEFDAWFLKSKNVIKMAVEHWVERTDNPPPKNATWMLRYFPPGQSPSAIMKSESAEAWRTKSP